MGRFEILPSILCLNKLWVGTALSYRPSFSTSHRFLPNICTSLQIFISVHIDIIHVDECTVYIRINSPQQHCYLGQNSKLLFPQHSLVSLSSLPVKLNFYCLTKFYSPARKISLYCRSSKHILSLLFIYSIYFFFRKHYLILVSWFLILVSLIYVFSCWFWLMYSKA